MNDDPMLSVDPDERQAYIDSVNKAAEEIRQQDGGQRAFWRSKASAGVTTLLGASGFGDGPYAVDTPAE